MADHDPWYDRRLLDNERERRMASLEDKVDKLDAKVDALSNRIALMVGGLAVLSFLLNIVGPIVVERLAR